MKIVANPKKMQRNYKIGLYTSLASLVFLFIAVGMTFSGRTDLVTYSFAAMILGLILSQVGVYFANRWGKPPRVDERISQGLKGLDDRYILYNYTSPVPYLLVGPAGVWVISAMYQGGKITFEKNRFQQQGVGFFGKVIGQEGLGRPELEAASYQQYMEKFLTKSMPDGDCPPVKVMIVFTSPKASVAAADAPIPTMHVEKLKDFVRRVTKEQPASMKEMLKVQELLPDQDIE